MSVEKTVVQIKESSWLTLPFPPSLTLHISLLSGGYMGKRRHAGTVRPELRPGYQKAAPWVWPPDMNPYVILEAGLVVLGFLCLTEQHAVWGGLSPSQALRSAASQ